MVTIRRERPDDADEVAGVHVRGWQVGYAGIMPAEVLTRLSVAAWAERRRQWRTADADHPFTTYVAEGSAGIEGFATVGPYRNGQDHEDLDPAYGEILALYVEPERWSTGVGRALMAVACDHLVDAGRPQVRLWVLEDNARARRFYERSGLAPDGERQTYAVPLSGGRDPVALEEIRYAAVIG
jgi:ribosomal protein S18 acetylase RimI-like enzyme